MTQRKGMGLKSLWKTRQKKSKGACSAFGASQGLSEDVAELQYLWGRQGRGMSDHSEGILPLSDQNMFWKNNLSPWFLWFLNEALFVRRIFTHDYLEQSSS